MIWDEGDANPLHRRIPGEVVSRRRPIPKKPAPEKEPDEVVVDLKAAAMLKPEARLKWLTKACKMVSDGTATSTEVYDIVVNRKFVSGMPERVVRKINAVIQDSLDLFSDKQQRYLSSNECPIMARLATRETAADAVPEDPGDADGGDDGSPRAATASAAAKAGTPGPPPAPQPRQLQSVRTPVGGGQATQPLQVPGGGGGDPSGSRWQAVKDEWAIRRQEAESKEQAKRDAAKKAEKDRLQKEEEDAASRRAAEAEAARRRKLEEEADNLFAAVVSAPPLALTSGGDRKRSRTLSRSRSISSRTARRLARANKNERAKGRGSWRQETASSALSGSRAIFMNRDFVEDLPHMPRPSTPGVQGVGGRVQRSPSRERSRRKH